MIDLSTVSTADLQAELSRREGVKTYVLGGDDSGNIRVINRDFNDTTTTTVEFSGPATITVNSD